MARRRAEAAPRTGGLPRSAALAILALLSAACAKPYDPFQIPAGEIRERVDTIALLPLRVSEELADRERLAPRIESYAGDRLSEGGFRLIPSDAAEALWQEHASGVGPIFDPRTGAVDEERWKVVRGAVARDLASRHGADALLDFWIAPESVHLPGSRPYLCGTRMHLYWPTDGPDGIVTVARGGCLYVQLRDLEGRLLYGIRAGLGWFATYAEQTRALRPVEERFGDSRRLREAVDGLLVPLVERAGR